MRGFSGLVPLALAAALALAGCNSAQRTAAPATAAVAVTITAPPVTVPVAQLPGNWGLASYHTATDRDRTVEQAKVACSNPYTIGQGTNGGITMHLADQTEPTEVFVKVDSAGRSFIGPQGPPGIQQDRVVMSFDNGVLIAEWLDPGVKARYGTMVLVRCA